MRRGLACLALLCVACSDPPVAGDAGADAGPAQGSAAFLYDPSSDGFFDTPFPSDSRTDAMGRPILTGFPRARGLVGDAIGLIEDDLPGFSPMTTTYFRFTGALDESSLPALADTRRLDGPVVIVDVDPDSPERGTPLYAYVRFRRDPSQFWASNTLTVRPVPGLHMHVGRRYAVVIQGGLLASDGTPVERSDAFEALKVGSDPHYMELFADLEAAGIMRDEVVAASMFTITDPRVPMDQARAFIMAQPLPTLGPWSVVSRIPRLGVFASSFETYELMDGEPPYMEFASGRIRFDAAGVPAVVRRRRVQIAVSVPTSAAPPEGYPIVLYGHGTGGDHQSHTGQEGAELASVGVAMLGFEAALHGERNPMGLQVESLLASNPIVAREIVRQTVIDMMLLYRMIDAGLIVVPAATIGEPDDMTFDTSRVLYMGHSQGAQEAGVLLGVEPTLEAAFLSEGGGGATITLVDRDATPGLPFACLVATVIGERCEDVTEDHPVLTQILQPMLDPADPLAFARRFHRERPTDWADLHIAMTEGTEDEQTPPRGIEALAMTIGLPIIEPVAQMTDPYMLAGPPSLTAPVTNNITLPSGGTVTGGLMQWAGADHFVIYDNADARNRYVEFFRTLLADGAPTLVPPL